MKEMIIILGSLLGLILFMLAFVLIGRLYWSYTKVVPSPYTGLPVRRTNCLRYTTVYNLYEYLKQIESFDNRPFNIRRAVLCRETGRLFPNCITWYGKIKLDWSFIYKRMEGNWVSWGSLTPDQQRDVTEKQGGLEGFQTELSSPKPRPRDIDFYYAHTKPGPLYVDITNYTVVGWKSVPETDLEVLVVQKPMKYI